MSEPGVLPNSGFVLHDYVLTFAVADDARRALLVERCRGAWLGDEITPTTWEISNNLEPEDLERAILELLGDGDRAAYYYLSDTKRIFRVMLG